MARPHAMAPLKSLEPELKTPSLSPSPAVGTTQAKSSWQGRMTEGNPPAGLGLAMTTACVILIEKMAGKEIRLQKLARRFGGVVS